MDLTDDDDMISTPKKPQLAKFKSRKRSVDEMDVARADNGGMSKKKKMKNFPLLEETRFLDDDGCVRNMEAIDSEDYNDEEGGDNPKPRFLALKDVDGEKGFDRFAFSVMDLASYYEDDVDNLE